MQKNYCSIVFAYLQVSWLFTLRQNKALKIIRSRRQRHRRVGHKIEHSVRNGARYLKYLHVQPQQHFHVRHHRNTEALSNEAGDDLILLNLIGDTLYSSYSMPDCSDGGATLFLAGADHGYCDKEKRARRYLLGHRRILKKGRLYHPP